MSGPICPDCGSFSIDAVGAGNECRLCAWSGQVLPRKRLHIEDMQRRSASNRDKALRWEKGEYCFLRVWVDDPQESEVVDLVRNSLDVRTIKEGRSYLYLELPGLPAKEILDKIRGMAGVTRLETRFSS